MSLSPEIIESLTPNILPPSTYSEAPKERDRPSLIRWMWSQFMLAGEFSNRVLEATSSLEEVWQAGIGLVPWRGIELDFQHHPNMQAAAHESGYVWGGIILTTKPSRPQLYEPEINYLSFEQGSFPIVVRYAQHEPQSLEIHDQYGLLGSAASWARTTKQNPVVQNCEGCITAEHILGSVIRNLDILFSGHKRSANALLFSPPCMDTAFLEANWPPQSLNAYAPQLPSSIASGDPVKFDGAVTSPVSGFVTHVSAHAKYSGSGFPMLVCHDGLGARGDSGALVDVNGLPTAMHLGKINLDLGGQESRGIFLHQICHVMDLELFG